MKNIFIIGGFATILIGGMLWWSRSLQSNDTDVISASGIHWHPRIEVFVGGEKQGIPANVGVGMRYAGHPHYDPRMGMTPMHTHEADGVIHMEFPGRVTAEDTKLKNFLSLLGTDVIDSDSPVTMTVNGAEAAAFTDYEMKDGDIIVLQYE